MSAADFTRVAKELRDVTKQANKRMAMERAVLVVEAEAKRQAPVKTGTLRRSITSRVERGGDRGVVGTNVRYARAVHDGSKPHIIRPTKAKALFWKGALHPVRSVRHPGYRGNPWFERAADRSRARVEAELKQYFQGVLVKVR